MPATKALRGRRSGKRWVATVKTVSTFPPPGLFNKSASEIAKSLASKKVSPKGILNKKIVTATYRQKVRVMCPHIFLCALRSVWARKDDYKNATIFVDCFNVSVPWILSGLDDFVMHGYLPNIGRRSRLLVVVISDFTLNASFLLP
jgi:hypothetical protein